MWTVEYTQEAGNYAIDSHPYNEAVLIAIEALALTQTGLPTEGYTEMEEGRYLWEVANHQVICRRIPERKTIRILVLKPIE